VGDTHRKAGRTVFSKAARGFGKTAIWAVGRLATHRSSRLPNTKEMTIMSNIPILVARLVFGKLLPRLAYPVIFGPLRGARFVLGTLSGECGGVSVYFNAVEPQQTSALVNTLNRGQVFFDIGANVGYYSILASRLVGMQGSVIAIEPVIRNLFQLYKHTILNKANNVTILPAACADSLSLSAFSSGINYSEGHLVGENANKGKGFRNVVSVVPTVTVDAVVKELDVFPDVIKIDVEGAEYLVLKGARATLLRARPRIFLSVHSESLRSTCLEYLEVFGYTFEELAPSEFLAKHTEP